MTDYTIIEQTLPSLILGLDYDISILSNMSALLNQYMEDINWVGYYLYMDGVLKLGPFQGKVACTVIPLDKGVCGKCARDKKSILVPDVHEFPGHIACDSASNSEVCVPILINNSLYGLLDIDSPTKNRFTNEDLLHLEKIVHILENELKK